MAEPYVVAQGLTKRYGDHPPSVDRVGFSLEKGEMLALLGPSGCGKTTILRMIAGLIEPTAGTIHVGGRDVAKLPVHRRNMGMVFQSYALLPHLTVAENVAFGLQMRGVAKAERARRVQTALELVKLGDKGARRITQLSGGQQQRAAIARSLVIEPDLLLLDEPLSNLDARLRDELRGEIRELQRRTRTTAIFVTHDQSEALAAADRIAVMANGRIEQIGRPEEIFDRPATRAVARFIGAGTFLEGVAHDGVAAVEGMGPVLLAEKASGPVTILLRPHRVSLLGAHESLPNQATGIVESAVYAGALVSSVVRVGPHRIGLDQFARGTLLQPGDSVTLGWRPEDAVLIPR